MKIANKEKHIKHKNKLSRGWKDQLRGMTICFQLSKPLVKHLTWKLFPDPRIDFRAFGLETGVWDDNFGCFSLAFKLLDLFITFSLATGLITSEKFSSFSSSIVALCSDDLLLFEVVSNNDWCEDSLNRIKQTEYYSSNNTKVLKAHLQES